MPEYLAPGVYVEETSFRTKSIEGVSTTTTGFIGPTRYGPIDIEPDVITSLGEFERTYGDRQQLNFTSRGRSPDGARSHAQLYVARRPRVLRGRRQAALRLACLQADDPKDDRPRCVVSDRPACRADRRHNIRVRARFPGERQMRVRLTLRLGQNVLGSEPIRTASQRERR